MTAPHPAAKDPLEAMTRGVDLREAADAANRRASEDKLAGNIAQFHRPPYNDHDDAPRPAEFSDETLALDFAERHQNDLRYVALWGKWLNWDGGRWKCDETLQAFDLVRHICREAATRRRQSRGASAVASAKTVAAVERLAKADRRLAATSDQWDADAWSLNTPGGVVDLRNGTVRPASPSDYNTRIAV
jgi:phage/plasmid-associated DNA primase